MCSSRGLRGGGSPEDLERFAQVFSGPLSELSCVWHFLHHIHWRVPACVRACVRARVRQAKEVRRHLPATTTTTTQGRWSRGGGGSVSDRPRYRVRQKKESLCHVLGCVACRGRPGRAHPPRPRPLRVGVASSEPGIDFMKWLWTKVLCSFLHRQNSFIM